MLILTLLLFQEETCNAKALNSRWDRALSLTGLAECAGWGAAGLTRSTPGQRGDTTMGLSVFAGKCAWEEWLKIRTRPGSLASWAELRQGIYPRSYCISRSSLPP